MLKKKIGISRSTEFKLYRQVDEKEEVKCIIFEDQHFVGTTEDINIRHLKVCSKCCNYLHFSLNIFLSVCMCVNTFILFVIKIHSQPFFTNDVFSSSFFFDKRLACLEFPFINFLWKIFGQFSITCYKFLKINTLGKVHYFVPSRHKPFLFNWIYYIESFCNL